MAQIQDGEDTQRGESKHLGPFLPEGQSLILSGTAETLQALLMYAHHDKVGLTPEFKVV